MWDARADGNNPLHFHLYGINNQNFIMRDEETGSWWQQVSGMAIHGPLKGVQLRPVPMDELSFALWKREHPNGRVLRPDPTVSEYESKHWEASIMKLPLAIHARTNRLADRDIVIGISIDGRDKAYLMKHVLANWPIIDTIGKTNVVLLVGDDGQSIRAFDRGRIHLFRRGNNLFDESGMEWNFNGRSASGQQLRPLLLLKDFWFDWENYHPQTAVAR